MIYHWILPIIFFFFNDTATTEIYTLSLHDALPICREPAGPVRVECPGRRMRKRRTRMAREDRKSTRLNSSHGYISYAVFCLKKKNQHRHSSVRTVLQATGRNRLD